MEWSRSANTEGIPRYVEQVNGLAATSAATHSMAQTQGGFNVPLPVFTFPTPVLCDDNDGGWNSQLMAALL